MKHDESYERSIFHIFLGMPCRVLNYCWHLRDKNRFFHLIFHVIFYLYVGLFCSSHFHTFSLVSANFSHCHASNKINSHCILSCLNSSFLYLMKKHSLIFQFHSYLTDKMEMLIMIFYSIFSVLKFNGSECSFRYSDFMVKYWKRTFYWFVSLWYNIVEMLKWWES